MARIPAKDGAPAEVPPMPFRLLLLLALRKPLVQLPPLQVRYGSWALEALRAMSGTSRWPSLGTPGPVCQMGLAKMVLAPPPLASRVPAITVSFQDISGIYWRAEAPLVGLEEPLQ